MIGQTIAHYRITAKLGEGGMGAVYRATDAKLDRQVAIKVLPESFARDHGRLARFEREAKVLASLNHPNIAAIYGVEERALVMELVEGPTLADRIKQGALAPEEALELSLQIAAAFEYAHDKGVVHRDLKPANVKITPDGAVKILDFGLAKAFHDPLPSSDPANSPTVTIGATAAGTILGTAAYMAPEQAKGKPVDRRADIWAFGVVLWEMLTGERLFGGEGTVEVLGKVLAQDPDLARVPSKFRKLLARCLDKNPKDRLRDIGEARFLLAEPETQATLPADRARPRGMWFGWSAAGVMAIALGAALWMLWPKPAELKPLVRLDLELNPPPSSGTAAGAMVVVSPDGTRLVWVAQGRLFTRRLDQPDAAELRGTEGAFNPFFSPDSQWVGFLTQTGSLKKMLLEGGPANTIAAASPQSLGAAWAENGDIFASLGTVGPVWRLPASGGKPETVSELDAGRETSQHWPQVLPGGKLLFVGRSVTWAESSVVGVNLADRSRRVLRPAAQMGKYLASPNGSGYLLYVTGSTLMAVRFDAARLEARGNAVPVLEEVVQGGRYGSPQFDVSQNGTAVFRRGQGAYGLTTVQWIDNSGKTQPLLAKPAGYFRPKFAPDGTRISVERDGEVWVYEWRRDTMIRIATSGGGPLWTPDGRHIVFSAANGLFWARSDGASQPQLLVSTRTASYPWSFSPDGKRLGYLDLRDGLWDIMTIPIENSDAGLRAGKPEPFLATPADERYPAFSPDGRWLAYSSDVSGTLQVYVRAFPDKGGVWPVSSNGGTHPEWSRTGRELIFRNFENQVMVAGYTVRGDAFVPERPRLWSETRMADVGLNRNFDLHPDGKRVAALMPAASEAAASAQSHVTILFNFLDELRRRVPDRGN
jgi:serine/threonine-protein kinase